MNTRRESSLNEKPFIRAYAENIFIDTIMNNEMTTGECVAKIQVDSMSKYNWNKMQYHSDVQIS